MKAEGWAAEHTSPAVKALTCGLGSGPSGTMLIFTESFGHLWALLRSKSRHSQGMVLVYLPQSRVWNRWLEAAFMFRGSWGWHGTRVPVFTWVWETTGETSGVCTMPSWATLPGSYQLCLCVAQKRLFPDLFVSASVHGKYTTQIWPQKTKNWYSGVENYLP